MDFVKNTLGIEVQFGKDAVMVYNACVKVTIFHKHSATGPPSDKRSREKFLGLLKPILFGLPVTERQGYERASCLA